jgi:MFS family permease
VLYFTQSAAGLLALILGVLVATNTVTLGMVYLLAFLLGWVNVFDNPARQTFVIEMVGEDKLRNAITLYSSLVNLARVIGPTIAAILIATIGIAPCFILNGLSYTAVVIMLALMRSSELHVTPPLPVAKGQLREGIDYVRTTPILRDTLVMLFIIGMLTFEFTVSLPLLAEHTFKSGASGLAYLTACLGFGAVIGGLSVASQRRNTLPLLVTAAFLFGGTVLAAALMPTLFLSGLILVFAGAASIYFTSLGNSILQLSSSPQMRGRVMSFWSIAFLGSTTIGGPVVGWCAETFGDRWGLAIGGIAGLFAGLIGLINLRNAHQESAAPE